VALRKLLIISVALSAACSTMRPVESPVAFLEKNNPSQVRVHSSDGELYVLREPQLRGDTIFGFESMMREEVRFSAGSIRRMEAVQIDKTRTTVFIGAMSVLAAAGVYMIINSGSGKGLICDGYIVGQRCVTENPSIRFAIPVR
jgi:hypothetical protein